MTEPGYRRPLISLSGGVIFHDGLMARVVIRKNMISVGCSDMTIEAMKYLLDEHKRIFGVAPGDVVIQDGVS